MGDFKPRYVFLSVSRDAIMRHPDCMRITEKAGTPYEWMEPDYGAQFAGWTGQDRAVIASPFYNWTKIALDLTEKTGEKPYAQFSLAGENSDLSEAFQQLLEYKSQFDARTIRRRLHIERRPEGPPVIALR